MPLGKAIIRALTLTCDEATRLLSGSQDRDMAGAERLALRVHLFICAACRRYRRQLRFMRDAVRKLLEPSEDDAASVPPGPSLSAEARERIKHNLHNR